VRIIGTMEPPEAAEGRAIKENRSGTQRAVRTYVAFLVALIMIYAIFLFSLSTAPYPGPRSNWTGYGFLSLALALIGAYGFGLTVLRAPKDLRAGATEVIVRERTGRVQRFPTGPGYLVSVLKRYPAGPFSEEPTEIVRVSLPSGSARIYLVDQGFFPEASTPASG
jgi:hypothetical protein